MNDKAALEKMRADLRRLLERRFGPLGDSLSQRIREASDLARLRAALDPALDLQTIREVEQSFDELDL